MFLKSLFKREHIRTRFAPSPTGYLHIGGLRTALYSYLFSKQHGGKFILRIEDTDVKRQVEGAVEAIYSGLKWAGIKHDEGPDIGGSYGPYMQSQRLDLYKKYANELLDKRHAYYCFCGDETLEKMREEQIAKKQAPKYDRRCLKLSKDEIKNKLTNGKPYAIRMKIPENRKIEFNDIVRGKITYNSNELDDQVLLKSDGYPTYHLAVVIDDYLMKISHVTRTEEWLPSTPKHILLYEYFGWQPPQWAHLPLLLNPDKTKMSKRKGDVALDEYIKKEYLPEAMINFLAFLGWNPDTEKEIYSMKELLKDFSLEKVHKAGAVFNIEKLDWLNGYYLRQLPLDELTDKIIPFLEKYKLINEDNYNFEYIRRIIALERPRIKRLDEVGERITYFFKIPQYKPELLAWRDMLFKDVLASLNVSFETLSKVPETQFNREDLEHILLKEAERAKNKDKGRLLWPLRAALTGLKASPSPFEILEILGKKESLKRIEVAIKKLA
jgi:glutamyl-tRNA synthetase